MKFLETNQKLKITFKIYFLIVGATSLTHNLKNIKIFNFSLNFQETKKKKTN